MEISILFKFFFVQFKNFEWHNDCNVKWKNKVHFSVLKDLKEKLSLFAY